MKINITQGSNPHLLQADFNIIIDVIRAFTVAHYAFINGAKKILLVNSVQDALQLKKANHELILAGEVGGLPIAGFDLDNSPNSFRENIVGGKTLVQKTTNGVRATLNCLNAHEVFVTGFSNAKNTAKYILSRTSLIQNPTINIIASHPSSDDDLACAEYMKGIIEGSHSPTPNMVVERIIHSQVADKFLNPNIPDFKKEDLMICIKEINTDFLMKVNNTNKIPMIERFNT